MTSVLHLKGIDNEDYEPVDTGAAVRRRVVGAGGWAGASRGDRPRLDAAGSFERQLSIAPGKFAELCGALAKGQSVQWSYEAASTLDFSIHYHQGKDVVYPARASASRSDGTLAVDAAQDYCWMWANKSAAAVALLVRLNKR